MVGRGGRRHITSMMESTDGDGEGAQLAWKIFFQRREPVAKPTKPVKKVGRQCTINKRRVFFFLLAANQRRGSVIVSKVKKDKRARRSANKHKRSTFVGCGSCSGKKLNPYCILQGVKRLNDIYLEKDGRLKGTSEGSA